jgi:hypothetical protein
MTRTDDAFDELKGEVATRQAKSIFRSQSTPNQNKRCTKFARNYTAENLRVKSFYPALMS